MAGRLEPLPVASDVDDGQQVTAQEPTPRCRGRTGCLLGPGRVGTVCPPVCTGQENLFGSTVLAELVKPGRPRAESPLTEPASVMVTSIWSPRLTGPSIAPSTIINLTIATRRDDGLDWVASMRWEEPSSEEWSAGWQGSVYPIGLCANATWARPGMHPQEFPLSQSTMI